MAKQMWRLCQFFVVYGRLMVQRFKYEVASICWLLVSLDNFLLRQQFPFSTISTIVILVYYYYAIIKRQHGAAFLTCYINVGNLPHLPSRLFFLGPPQFEQAVRLNNEVSSKWLQATKETKTQKFFFQSSSKEEISIFQCSLN